MISKRKVDSTPIYTKGHEFLLGVVYTTCKNSFELFYGLVKNNPNSLVELNKLETALKNIRFQLEIREQEQSVQKK